MNRALHLIGVILLGMIALAFGIVILGTAVGLMFELVKWIGHTQK